MRRPQAVGFRAVMLGLLVISILPAAAHAARPIGGGLVVTPARQVTPDAFELAHTAKQAVKAGTTDQACTGWRSTLFPPPTIRVLRTRGPNAGKVYIDPVSGTPDLPFRDYVGVVFAAEWPGYYPAETLKTGAIAVKQYGWYYTIVYRGGVDANGVCYDVQDNTNDQYYQPEKRAPLASHLRAIEATWGVHLRKTDLATTGRGRFILTGYRSGAGVPCGEDTDHFHLYQHSAFVCGRDGLNMEQILRKYLEPRLEIVTPGQHDIVGEPAGRASSEMGDISGLVVGRKGSLIPHIWKTGRSTIAAAAASNIDLRGPGLLGFRSEDANGDGWDDLVVARHTGATSLTLTVAKSDGDGYTDGVQWFAGDIGMDPSHARLLTGDFDGDMRADAALMIRGDANAEELLLFRHKKGNGFQAPVRWWSGTFDPDTTSVLAGDMNGDGRDDLVLITDLGDGGRRYRVAPSAAPADGLGAPVLRYVATDLVGGVVRHAVGDVTRDGRDDLILLDDGPARTRIEVLRTVGNRKRFVRSTAWRTDAGRKLPFDELKIATSDMDYDGLTDLVVFRDRGSSGTEVMTFRTRSDVGYGSLSAGPSVQDAGVAWGALRPY